MTTRGIPGLYQWEAALAGLVLLLNRRSECADADVYRAVIDAMVAEDGAGSLEGVSLETIQRYTRDVQRLGSANATELVATWRRIAKGTT